MNTMSQWPEESARIKDAPGILSKDVVEVDKRNLWAHLFGNGKVVEEREKAWISSKYCSLYLLQINAILIYASNENTFFHLEHITSQGWVIITIQWVHALLSFKNVMFIINFYFLVIILGYFYYSQHYRQSMFGLVGQSDKLLFVVSRIYIILLENEKRLDFLCIRKFA